MAATQSLHLVFGFIDITNEPLETGMWNLVRRHTINIPTNSVRNIAYRLMIMNMATVRNF